MKGNDFYHGMAFGMLSATVAGLGCWGFVLMCINYARTVLLWNVLQVEIVAGFGLAVLGAAVQLLIAIKNKGSDSDVPNSLVRSIIRLGCIASVGIVLELGSFAAQQYWTLPLFTADVVCLGLIVWLIRTGIVIAKSNPQERTLIGVSAAGLTLVLASGCIRHVLGVWTYNWAGLAAGAMLLLLFTALYLWVEFRDR